MLIDELSDLGVLKFGSYTLKSGAISPYYIDLRLAISSPDLLVKIADVIQDAVQSCSFDLVCGVPYTALPFATAFSIRKNVPMILKRKERKTHGTGKMCEGVFRQGQTCLLIEDVITSGQSILETVEALEHEGLVVKDIASLIDREQGGRKLLESKGYRLHSIYPITQIVKSLSTTGKLDAATASAIAEFIRR